MIQFRRCSVVVALAASLSSLPALAQPGLDSMGFPGASRERSSGFQGIVNAGMTWDPDGPGPLTDRLVIGGSFRSVDGITAESIAIWDGQQWGPMGAGFLNFQSTADLGNIAEVTALTVHNEALHAAISGFDTVSVRRWDGTNWVAVGGSFNGRANVLASVQGALVAGLSPYSLNSSIPLLVRQNPNGTWSALPGTPAFATNASVRAIAEFQGDLFVAGDFMEDGIPERIVRRTAGGQWSSTQLGCQGTCTGSVRSLVVANNQLFAAGDFNTANGQFPGTVRWNGSGWTGVGSPSTTASVRSMIATPEGALLRTSNGWIQRWDGQAWQDQGLNRAWDDATSGPRLVAVFGGRPVIGGAFFSVTESLPSVFHISREIQPPAILAADGFWRSPTRGIDGYVRRLVRIDNDIIATGPIYGAGGQPAGFLSRYTPQGRWEPWYDGIGFDRPTRAITQFEGDIIVSGAFSEPGGSLRDPVVRRWNGAAWIDLPGLPGLAEHLLAADNSLWAWTRERFDSGSPYWLFRWSGQTWQQVLDIEDVDRPMVVENTIWATRTTASSWPRGEIVRLQNGQWQAAGGSSGLGKQLLGVFDGEAYAADALTLYRYLNDQWQPAGLFPWVWRFVAFEPENTVEAHGGWYLSGYQHNNATFIAFWDRSRWSTLGLGGGQPSPATWGPSLARWQDQVLVGGLQAGRIIVREPPYVRFRAAKSLATIRAGWPIQTPALIDMTADAGQQTILGSDAPANFDPNWFVNGRLISLNAEPDYRFQSAGPGQLRIVETGVRDTGPYTVSGVIRDRVYNTAGWFRAATFATPAYLTILPTCDPIDFNNDGSLFDPVDIDAFFSVFAEGPCLPLGATCNDIDFNNDTIRFDPRDIDAFLSVFTGGPCQ
jgi:hypothetical protein